MCSLKKCPKCGIEKELSSEFWHKNKRNKDGFEWSCKECRLSDSRKALREEHLGGFRVCLECKISKPIAEFKKSRYDKFAKEGQLTTTACCRECNNERMRIQRIRNKTENCEYHSIREKLNGARKRAKTNGYKFDITIEDLMPFPTHCEILGIELDYKVFGNSRPENTASLDKIIPDLGYVKGNVKIISHKANRLKSDLDFDTIEKIKAYMIRHSKE